MSHASVVEHNQQMQTYIVLQV